MTEEIFTERLTVGYIDKEGKNVIVQIEEKNLKNC